MLYCPQCGAEYREGYTSCSDCHVFLAHERPRSLEQESISQPGDPNLDPFCSFWKGTDARICAELSTVLDEAEIPHKTIHRADHLFLFSNQVPYELGVPASLYEKAELVVKEAFGTDEETGEDAVPLLAAPETPEADLPRPRSLEEGPEEWFEQDATSEVWGGEPSELQEIIEMSLRENDIRTRWQPSQGKPVLFVLPENESRAREIIREILESTPPA
jgi:hypothetical protein